MMISGLSTAEFEAGMASTDAAPDSGASVIVIGIESLICYKIGYWISIDNPYLIRLFPASCVIRNDC